MTSLSTISIDNFIDKELAKEFECSICLSIMDTVCEFDKCGHLLCKKCIAQISQCPICKDKQIYYHISTYLKRKQ